ncbi:PREDICTED: uncharacterized protein LOC104809519 [Tarenaya hassleriana]|uniref:uncharacterized protein LOC104809519 n=1 Tax=Tarenaya hassleriana TaxID=28532 RepID=UPI0008FD04B1|nr:PREDICTED: uncharacterized protein LOC104809519 [Tarenaya hassleriana]
MDINTTEFLCPGRGIREMEEDFGFLVSILIISMDISAAVLGIEAEIAQSKAKHSGTSHSECGNPSSAAFAEGIAALILLCIAHATANLHGGCICFRAKQDYKKASANKILAVAFLLLSWITLAVAFSTLMVGTLANSGSNKFCDLSSRWLFLVGGIFCLKHGMTTAAYYVSATAAKREEQRQAEQESQIHGRHA